MKKIFWSSFIFFVLITIYSFLEGPRETINIGEKAPLSDVEMLDISGKKLALNAIKQENGLLVIFSCNTCPFVIEWENRYPELSALCKSNNIGMVLVNSNETKRENEDSFDNMKKHALEKNYDLHYVVDEKSSLANAFGAKTTPHVFLFNKNMELIYKGAIDDNSKNAKEVKESYLKNAIKNASAGKDINPNQTKPIGCSIKRTSL